MRKIAIIGTDLTDLGPRASKVELFEWEDVSSDTINLRDYDGVVVDVSSLQNTVAPHTETVFSASVLRDILKGKNSFFVIVGNPATTLTNKSIAEKVGINVVIVKGQGDSIRVPKKSKGSRFEAYTSRVKRFTYSYNLQFEPTEELKRLVTNKDIPSAIVRSAPLLVTRADYGIASISDVFVFKRNQYHSGRLDESEEPFKGDLVFLPPLETKGEQFELILSILDSENDKTEVPEWVEEISVVGQDEVDEAVASNEAKLVEVTAELESLAQNRAAMRQALELLYKADKPLEKSLKTYMSKLGFTVSEPSDESNKVEFYLEKGSSKFVVEVKSTTKQMFDQKGLRQANDWRDDVMLTTGETFKPLFIGSNQYNLKPSERSDDYLAQNLIDYAVSRDIACITVGQLFEELQKIEAKKMTTDELAQKLHATKGLYIDNRNKDNIITKSKG